ncbi:methyltransferase domain-containing protein [uncultured Methanofollis sp.]|uniref:methyltransferase domain-containing protein n=1 Tax=uncultured Methanofollis sp. TaxID=262500 RepID=UPI0026053BC5|nr:methyltransferase domain-containing protein [uncultured Methanofollis sp.]
MFSPGEFFDTHSERYSYANPLKHDVFFVDFMKKNGSGHSLLDIGGGGGAFAKYCKSIFPDADICVVDPSKELLQKQNAHGIKRVVGSLPDDINVASAYHYIAMKVVLHHVVGTSIRESKDLVKKSILAAKSKLDDGGYVFIREIYYESYLIPTFTRTIIFYLLRLQNRLKLKIPHDDFISGLEVCFYTRDEIESMIRECNLEIVESLHDEYDPGAGGRVMLLKRRGTASYILRPRAIPS